MQNLSTGLVKIVQWQNKLDKKWKRINVWFNEEMYEYMNIYANSLPSSQSASMSLMTSPRLNDNSVASLVL